MQLTTIVVLLAASASAAPGMLSPRQSFGSVRARFYDRNDCDLNGSGPAKAEVVLQASNTLGKAGCQDLTVGPYNATFFDQSTLSKKIRLLNVPCSQVSPILDQTPGNWIDIGPRNNNIEPGNMCKVLSVRSYLTLP